jgi:tRNA1Val (adenine37-N6)-methyltransferase
MPLGARRKLSDDYLQPRNGYRFSQDSPLLARWAPPRLLGRAADLGAGCGVVGLEALAAGRLQGLDELLFVEADPAFRESLSANVARASAAGAPALTVIWADWRSLAPGDLRGPLDLILANPPHHPAGAGRPPARGRLMARHEILGRAADFLAASARLLAPGGRLLMSWPRRRLADVVGTARDLGLATARLATEPGRAGASLALLELVRIR